MLREQLSRWAKKLKSGRKLPEETWVTLGGQIHRVEPLRALEGIKLCMIVGPYVPKLWEIGKAFSLKDKSEIKTGILRGLVNEMEKFPGDLIKAVGLLIKREPRWLIENATAQELFTALIKLNEFSGFWNLLMLGMGLGLVELKIEED